MNFKQFPFYKQHNQMDCGPTCLKIISKYYGRNFPLSFLSNRANITRSGVSFANIAEAAESIGFQTLAVHLDFETFKDQVPLPCIAYWNRKHFIVVYKISKKSVFVADPAHGLLKYNISEFLGGWIDKKRDVNTEEGHLLVLEPTPNFYSTEEEQFKKKLGFSFLLKYFKPYRKLVIQLIIGLLAGSLLQLVFPFLTQAVVDYGINYQNLNFIYLILIAQLTLFVSKASVEMIRGWILLHTTSRININIMSDFLIKLMRLPISFYDSQNAGDIIQRIDDHRRIQHFLSTTTLNTLFSTFSIIIFGTVLAYYNLIIFLTFIVGSIIYIGWTLLFMKKRAELDYKRFDQAADNQSSLIQLISGMQEIKLNGSERRRRWEWEDIQVKLFKIAIKGLTLSQTQNTGGIFLNEIKNILISFIAAKSVIEGELTLGMMLSIQYIIGQLNLPIYNFISFIQSGQDAKITLERLSEIHNLEDEEVYSDDLRNELTEFRGIRLKNVSFRYGGTSSPLVLDNLNFEIPEGKVTAIVGTSGSGKTTLIKLLLRFYNPTKGEILLGKNKLSDFKFKTWRRNCGSVMQDGFIFGDTILRNITESDSENEVSKERLINAAEVSNIRNFIEAQPQGFNTKIGLSGSNISGGQKQRILIARSVYKNPKFIFFDEATSSLDGNNEKVIMDNLQQFYKGKTVVIVAHRLSTVKNADQIIVLDNGKIVEKGNHAELTNSQGAYYALVKNQLELAK